MNGPIRMVTGHVNGYHNGKTARLRALKPGGTVVIQGTRGAAHQLAHRVFGAGNYNVQETDEGVQIQRVDRVVHTLYCARCNAVLGFTPRAELCCYCIECKPYL